MTLFLTMTTRRRRKGGKDEALRCRIWDRGWPGRGRSPWLTQGEDLRTSWFPPLLWRFPKSWNPYNVKPVSTDISVTVAQIQKIQKTRCIFFRILLLEGPSPPSQLVPNPFNWSPNTVFCRYLSNGHSNKKNPKTRCIFYQIMLLGGPSPKFQDKQIPPLCKVRKRFEEVARCKYAETESSFWAADHAAAEL